MARLPRILVGIFLCAAAAKAPAKNAAVKSDAQPLRQEVVDLLRARGPDGLTEALQMYDRLAATDQQMATAESNLNAWQAAIDQIGGQRGCTVSRLYWYTDLAAAKAAAERTGRPILSLRMLGKLTDEFSCANSRFFRTALYSNKNIGDYLRDNFILHWQSVRPVPRVTIDFGDGRRLERTCTGNSAHYVLSTTGEPLDVLPGLYSPQAFLKWLHAMHSLSDSYNHVRQSAAARGPRLAETLKQYHQQRLDSILKAWDLDLQKLGEKKAALIEARIDSAKDARQADVHVAANGPAPHARLAANRATAKSAGERPLLRFAGYGGQWMERGMDDELWREVANLHRGDVQLDASSVAIMRREFPNAALAARAAVSKSRVEDPVLRLVRSFEDSMSLDTVRNEYLLHRRVHEMLAASPSGSMDFDRLNEWVYAELFLTPSSDPWLGLAPRDVYSALDHDGRVEPKVQLARQSGG